MQDIIDADPDVFVIVDASWDSAVGKIDYLHNHTDFCGMRAVQKADYIKIQFSASTLGPRNGVAALDMVAAAIHVTTGDATMNFQSGVDFFDPEMLAAHTAGLLCPVKLDELEYSGSSSSAPPSQPTVATNASNDDVPAWSIVLIIVLCVLFLLFFFAALLMYLREKQGKPIFVSLDNQQAPSTTKQSEV